MILSSKFFVAFYDVWYSMSDIDVIFAIPIPPSLTVRDKSWCSSSLHVFLSSRDVINFCRMTFSMGFIRWMMLCMVRIMCVNFCLKFDVNAQYAACGDNLTIFDINFSSFTHSFTFMNTYSFLHPFVPTTYLH